MTQVGAVPELAQPADLASLAVTFAAAFADDAMFRWSMPDATPATLQSVFRATLAPYVDFGVLWQVGGCEAGAAWLPPQLADQFAEIDQSVRATISPLTGDGGVRYAALLDWLAAHLPAEPCWFLDLVAVAPSAQGRGLGRTLVRHGVERAQADGCPAFLETANPRSVPLYQSLGFQIVDEQRAPDGGPTIWFMATDQ